MESAKETINKQQLIDWLMAKLERARERNDEHDENVYMTMLDEVSGWCGPHRRLFK